MDNLMQNFIKENADLKTKECKHDKKFLLIENTTSKTLSELCAKYGASGPMIGKQQENALIGNFGKYK